MARARDKMEICAFVHSVLLLALCDSTRIYVSHAVRALIYFFMVDKRAQPFTKRNPEAKTSSRKHFTISIIICVLSLNGECDTAKSTLR